MKVTDLRSISTRHAERVLCIKLDSPQSLPPLFLDMFDESGARPTNDSGAKSNLVPTPTPHQGLTPQLDTEGCVTNGGVTNGGVTNIDHGASS